MARIFLTGAGGFLGRAVLDELARVGGHELVLLLRRPDAVAHLPEGAEVILGDLLEPERFAAQLRGCDLVVHMAAMTGKAAPEVYHTVNREGTSALLDAAAAAGVPEFIFVSTIASGYPKQKYYPYAQSKAAAEADVAASGLAYTILRPTIIMGDGSPIAETLGKIAGAPVIPLPQSGGPVSVQPVHVRDVARGIVTLIGQPDQKNETLDLGGPEALTFRDFLARLHIGLKGKEPGFLPIPLAPIQWGLSLIEPVARKVMPATAGQLSVFGNPSTAADNWLMETLRPTMVPLWEMLPGGPDHPPAGPSTPPRDIDAATRQCLSAEAALFTRYLAETEADDLITQSYIAGVVQLDMLDDLEPFEEACLRLARRGMFLLTITDAYCALFARSGSLRRRLILMLAILEKAPATAGRFRKTPDAGPVRAGFGLIGAGLRGGLSFAAGLVVCLPMALFSRIAR